MWRCKDEMLRAKLMQLRTAMPDKDQLAHICNQHKCWSHLGAPLQEEVKAILDKKPNVTMATCTRKGAALLNESCVSVLFEKKRKTVLATLDGDWETNPDNYDRNGKLKDQTPLPSNMKVFAGMKVFLTRNINKKSDFVNGMLAVVRSYDEASRCLHVQTATGRQLAVFPVTEDGPSGGRLTYYPARPGYASTIHKLQGAELDSIAIWLDVKYFKAGAYVAMSRVQYDTDYVLGGMLEREHFVPAR
eukprot:476490-Amphidinium_carterae.1